ncbi:MAG: glycoside hydrolase family 2 TIM barrel-domain containing protein, partial [Opitutaceae bacterium]
APASSPPPASGATAPAPARITRVLDGTWEIGESLGAEDRPAAFPARGPVPGLVNLAEPAFPAVDEFDSCEILEKRIQIADLPQSEWAAPPGRSRQPRNYFWYRTRFAAPAGKSAAWLTIGKAQFGMAVWLNGRPLGEEPACFSSGRFELTPAVRWGGENELVARIGAHPGVLPASYPAGTDFEKFRWTPGIYDTVEAAFCDDPAIASVQVAPRLEPRGILVQVKVANRSRERRTGRLELRVREWRGGAAAARTEPEAFTLEAGEERTLTREVALPGGRLWSPSDPFLYELEAGTGGDAQVTRFGLREFHGERATGEFRLNGRPCRLRGSNIALHRFLEDPECGALPWTESWVRRLLEEIPRRLHWNAFRITLGPVPRRWLEIADECGLLFQNEFFMWTSHPRWHASGYSRHWDADELVRQYGAWMADHWNHPSVVIWDACNETFDRVFGERVIPAVRGLDLSRRPWDNGYNEPVDPDDPIEIHPYFHLASHYENRLQFDYAELETMTAEAVIRLGSAEPNWHGNPIIVNEYGWLWLNRDDSPASLAERIYPMVLGPNATAADRRRFYAWATAAETEFFRASRRFAGVLHFVYLSHGHPGGYTADPFRDLRTLALDPDFEAWVGDAFKPLGVFLRFFQPTLTAGADRTFPVMLVNDEAEPATGRVLLTLEDERGAVVARGQAPFALAGHGASALEIALAVPARMGRHRLKAAATPDRQPENPTISRREVELVEPVPARLTLSLDGEWEIGESREVGAIPETFPATGPVPGLANLARPPFPDVDAFDGCEVAAFRANIGEISDAERVPPPGHSRQDRNYFWYRRTFRAPAGKSAAWLTLAKAQFGMAVWLNGVALGEDRACFSSGRFELTPAVRWGGENTLMVRVGAHPGVLPADLPAGTDFEKFRFTPGIYDTVEAAFCDNPAVMSVQVAPRLNPPAITIQVRLVNRGAAAARGILTQRVTQWRGGAEVARSEPQPFELASGEERTITHTLPLPAGTKTWSPEDPFLHVLETGTGGDLVRTRFGLREFRGDARTGRFLLNGAPCYLRGSNIALHRFLEDPDCGALPWTESWVRRLLEEIPRRLHWNAFRITLGPVPRRWLEIADECGLLLQNEFFMWTSHPKWHAPKYSRKWDEAELIRQYGNWMADHWNHPSVVIWDACNETFDPVYGSVVIPAVRGLDLSGRPWDNGYNEPVDADDPIEIHPYFLLNSHFDNRLQFQMADLETMSADAVIKLGSAEPIWHGNPVIINEYGWLWLNRDGTPTRVADRVYRMILGADATPEQRFAYYAYAIAAETEFFRASRRFAGVLHFVYLTYSKPEGYTSDPFRDVRTLELEPHFADYAAEAFKPLGAYLDFFRPTLVAGTRRSFVVKLVNDLGRALVGAVHLVLQDDHGAVAEARAGFSLEPFGTATVELALELPGRTGEYLLRAAADAGRAAGAPTVSRRRVALVAAEA